MNAFSFQPDQSYSEVPHWWDPLQSLDFSAIPYIPEVVLDEAVIGFEPQIQTFYEGPEKVKDKINWVERIPTKLPEAAKEKYDKVAICVYKAKDRVGEGKNYGGLATYNYHSIEIQSRVIIAAIKPILAANGTSIANDAKLELRPPFSELYFSHAQIKDKADKASPGSDERSHLALLVQVMDELFKDLLPCVTSLHSMKYISFNLCWTLFPKGILVYRKENNTDRLYRVVSTRTTQYNFRMTVEYVQFNGSYFGVTQRELYFRSFRGIQSISSLDTYPLGFHSDKSLEERLLERGKRTLDFQDIRYREYNNAAIELTEPADDIADPVEWYNEEHCRDTYFQVFGVSISCQLLTV